MCVFIDESRFTFIELNQFMCLCFHMVWIVKEIIHSMGPKDFSVAQDEISGFHELFLKCSLAKPDHHGISWGCLRTIYRKPLSLGSTWFNQSSETRDKSLPPTIC